MNRLFVPISPTERAALWQYAQRERRDPREQVALVLCERLRAEGLLPDVAQKNPLTAKGLAAIAASGLAIQPPQKDFINAENTPTHAD